MAQPTVFISGVHTGPNPAAGIGVARSLRSAFPEFRLIGVDYSAVSSGLNWPELTSFQVFPDWTVIDRVWHTAHMREVLHNGAIWLSVSDREIHWLVEALPTTRGLVVPPKEAVAFVAKPCDAAAKLLGVEVPSSVAIDDEYEAHAFCRRSGWNVWAKGPVTDAVRCRSWLELEVAVEQLADMTHTRHGIFIQKHVEGCGESIAFTAFEGKLLGAVSMVKRDITLTGKTWTGCLSPITRELTLGIERFVTETRWTGGGEVEMIRDGSGTLWLQEINPRFPGWIFGATLAGINLPARLISTVLGVEFREDPPQTDAFTRVVVEIPVRKELAAIQIPRLLPQGGQGSP